jgi:titin
MPRTNKILIRSGTTTPSASDFAVGEPAFDKSAGKLYIKNAAGTMVELGTGGGGGGGGSVDVYAYATPASFPATGSSAVIYIATDTSRAYQWADTAYMELGPIGGNVDTVLRSLLVPPAPTNLIVATGDAQATLSWTAPTVLAQTPITDYTEQYSSDDGANWTTFTQAASTATSATVTGLTNGTAYKFRVAAVNAVGVGAYTAASSSVIPGIASAPTGLTATAGNAQLSLAWTAPANTGASAITGYTVEYTPSGGSAQTVSTGSAGNSYTLTGLTNGTAYTARVAAVNSVGTGTYTAASSSVTPAAMATVTGGTVATPGDGYRYHTFTTSGTLAISSSALTADVLVVGAGGSGGLNFGSGGGGGGGVRYATNQSIAAGTYAVTVAPTAALDNSGGPSSIGSLYSATGGVVGVTGGGYGATDGGASGLPTSASNTVANSGGLGDEENDYGGGGQGGGAGGVGLNGIRGQQRNSANGRIVFGVEYGRGGRGGLNISAGGSTAYNGANNTGNGGSGGGDRFDNVGRGTGGSGVVIIRYPVA